MVGETNSLRLQIHITPQLYKEICEFCAEKGWGFNTDSAMIRFCLDKFLRSEEFHSINTYRLENLVKKYQNDVAEKQTALDLLQHNIQIQKEKGSTKKKKNTRKLIK